MPTVDVVIAGKLTTPEVGGGPVYPPGIWGPTDPRPTPPIYIPVPPPPESGLSPEHPIYVPVMPAHPIVIPRPPAHPEHPIPPVVWPPLPPKPPLGMWGGAGEPFPTPPIYIPVPQPPGGAHPEHPIYLPVYPAHPIVLPPEGERPQPPPDMVSPPTGQPGFWGYSLYYDSMVFVPFEGAGPQAPAAPAGARRGA